MKRIVHIFFILCAITVQSAYAQRIVSDRITYTYVIPSNESIREAEISAVRLAQQQMIADNFGTSIGASTSLMMSGKSYSSTTFGDIMVKGEWIETIGLPEFKKRIVNDEFVIDVTVSGKIREIISNPSEILCQVIKSPDDEYESLAFRHGEYMYVSFQSSENGYLAIYITDGETVQSLYPYNGLDTEYMYVRSGKKHVLFSRNHSEELDPYKVIPIRLSCDDKDVAYNRIYVVFSPNRFAKAIDSANVDSSYRTLEFESFHSWLSRLRRTDTDVNVRPIDITIER